MISCDPLRNEVEDTGLDGLGVIEHTLIAAASAR